MDGTKQPSSGLTLGMHRGVQTWAEEEGAQEAVGLKFLQIQRLGGILFFYIREDRFQTRT